MKTRNLCLALLLCGACLTGAKCSSDDGPLFARADQAYRDQDYDNAIDLLKRYLMRHPDHSGAHLYLGSCYALGAQWMVAAEGEIETALFLFNRDGKKSTIARFPDTYFELRCYFELIRIAQMRVEVLLSQPQIPEALVREHVAQFRKWVDEAKRVFPEDPYVKEFEAYLVDIESALASRTTPPRGPLRLPEEPPETI